MTSPIVHLTYCIISTGCYNSDPVLMLKLMHRNEINVSDIIQLLIRLKAQKEKDASKTGKGIFNLLNTIAT